MGIKVLQSDIEVGGQDKSCIFGNTTDSCTTPFSNVSLAMVKLTGSYGSYAGGTISIFITHSL